jgi:hypothetical protein
MNAQEFYNDFVSRYEIQKKYQNKDKRQLLFEVIEKYAEHKQLLIHSVVKSFTAEQVVKELEDCETLDDAIMFFKEHK